MRYNACVHVRLDTAPVADSRFGVAGSANKDSNYRQGLPRELLKKQARGYPEQPWVPEVIAISKLTRFLAEERRSQPVVRTISQYVANAMAGAVL